jgi:RNA polymerase sigma-70 factor (ECF subfamily)
VNLDGGCCVYDMQGRNEGDVAIDAGLGRTRAEVRPEVTRPRDDATFTAFYEEHFRTVSGYALSLVGDPGLAADVTQEAMTRLYLRWRRVNDPRTWVFFVATNLTRDHWRRVGRERSLIEALAPSHQEHDRAHDPWLRDLVERLPLRLREPVLLHYYADLPVEQVAQVMRRPLGTVKQRLHQARKQLAQAVEESS